jgi:hypothetical protein
MYTNKKRKAYAKGNDTIPNVLSTKLVTVDRDSRTSESSGSETIKINDAFDPFTAGTNVPYGKAELDSLYQEYLVKACKVSMQMGGNAENFHLFIWSSPDSSVPASLSYNNLAEIPGVKHMLLGTTKANAQPKMSLYRTVTSVLGHELTSNNKAAVTASPAEVAYIHVAWTSESGSADGSFRVYIKVKQYVDFMQRKLL